jgi:hypothetical protein
MKILSSLSRLKRRRGIVLVTVLLMMPIMLFLIMFIGQVILRESGFAKMEKERGRSFYLAEAAGTIAYHAFATSSFEGSTASTRYQPGVQDDPTAAPLAAADPQRLTLSPALAGWNYDDTTGWYTWSYDPDVDPVTKSMCGGGYPEMMRFRLARFTTTRAGSAAPMREWQILAEGRFDRFSRVHEIAGRSEPLFNNALADFGGGGLSEFLRGPAQEIYGKVHSNADMYFKPGSSLKISGVIADKSYTLADGTTLAAGSVFPGSHGITTAGKIVAHRDAWNRNRTNGSEVNISIDGTPGNTRSMNKIDSEWFGSTHPKWNHPTEGAAERFEGFVRDYQLGAKSIDPPATQSFDGTGLYANSADLRVDYTTAGGWISKKTFRNSAERRDVEYMEIDVAKLRTDNGGADWPRNGAIYSDVPVVLINAGNLKKPSSLASDPDVPNGLTVVSDSTIYTRGDFNMNHPTPAHLQKKTDTAFFQDFYTTNDPNAADAATNPLLTDPAAFSAAVQTRFAPDATPAQWAKLVANNPDLIEPPFKLSGGTLVANDASIYTPKKTGSVWEGNAHVAEFENRHSSALMTNDRIYHVSEGFAFPTTQGQPTANDPRKFAADSDQLIEINSALVDGAVTVDERKFAKRLAVGGNPQVPVAGDYGSDSTWENSDDFLENLGGSRTVRKRGSVIHMGNARMSADYDNLESDADESAGITPWIRETAYNPPFRDYQYDPELLLDAPPLTPYGGTRERWAHIFREGVGGFGDLASY